MQFHFAQLVCYSYTWPVKRLAKKIVCPVHLKQTNFFPHMFLMNTHTPPYTKNIYIQLLHNRVMSFIGIKPKLDKFRLIIPAFFNKEDN